MMNLRYTLLLIFLLVASLPGVRAQNFDDDENVSDTTNVDEESIDIYDKFNPFLGGDSIRWKEKGVKYTGFYEDYYNNGKLKHKGYYTNGQLTTIYKNYFDNGQLERSFKVSDSRSCQMEMYYKNGILKSKIEYLKGQVLRETDYYSNGKMEYSEENDKSFEFYICMNYYFKSGNPQSTLELTDKKNKIYDSKEYWESGNVKTEGKMFFNKA